MTISVVIPVYNGEKTIGILYEKLKKELKDSFCCEIILVSDGSKDNSNEVIKAIVAADPEHVTGYYLLKNNGQHNAILFGIEKSTGDFVVTLDDDLQHDPVYIKQLVKKQKEGNFDVVYAKFNELSHSAVRIRISALFRKGIVNFVPGICPYYSPFRLIKKKTAKEMLKFNTPYVYIDGYLGRITSKFAFIEAEHKERGAGKSSYSFFRLLKHAVLILYYYSRFNNSKIQKFDNNGTIV